MVSAAEAAITTTRRSVGYHVFERLANFRNHPLEDQLIAILTHAITMTLRTVGRQCREPGAAQALPVFYLIGTFYWPPVKPDRRL
jgi:hypothetical protein